MVRDPTITRGIRITNHLSMNYTDSAGISDWGDMKSRV